MSGAIIDLDGTVYRSTIPVTGAVEGITKLRDADVDILFVSNTSTKSRDACLERLKRIGIEVSLEDIVTSALVTANYVSQTYPDEEVLAIGGEALIEELRRAGVSITDNPNSADVLVVGKDRSFDYDTLTRGLRALDRDTPFVVTNQDRTSPTEDGIVPGAGAIIGAIVAAAGREPDVVAGKPNDPMIDVTLDRLDAPPSRCLVIGDNVNTDVAMGQRAEMTTVLVRSGVDNNEVDGEQECDPDYILDSMATIDEVLKSSATQ